MPWLFIIIVSYFLFACSSLVDKYLLSRVALNPKIYIFYIGIFGMLVFLLVPFVGFSPPSFFQLLLGVGAGISLAYAVFRYFEGLQIFEPSRMIPAIGGLVPIFTFLLVFLVSRGHVAFSFMQLASFLFLMGGTVLITFEKEKMMNIASLRIALVSAFFTAISFVMAKYVYLSLPFWSGLMVIRLGAFLVAIWFFMFSKEVQHEILGVRKAPAAVSFWRKPRVALMFFSGQAVGALAELLRNFAVFLVPLFFLPFIHALQGIEYVAVFFLAILLSLQLPRILKEEISPAVIWQKLLAIFAIVIGLALFAFA